MLEEFLTTGKHTIEIIHKNLTVVKIKYNYIVLKNKYIA